MTYEDIIKSTTPLIHKIVNKYSLKGYDKDDLLQECYMKIWVNYKKYNNDYKITTFIYPLLDNHLKRLCRKQTTQSRSNHAIGNKGNDIILKDIKDYDFSTLLQDRIYTNKELDVISVAYDLLNEDKNKDVLEDITKGFTQTSIANRKNVSKQHINKLWIDYINQVKEEIR